jgi:hypothetical protein
MPVLDNQLKSPSPLLVPARVSPLISISFVLLTKAREFVYDMLINSDCYSVPEV